MTSGQCRIVRVRCSRAEQFLKKLSPSDPLWHPDPSMWIFRGHADASWRLVAKAHRLDGATDRYRAFGVALQQPTEISPPWSVLIDAEEQLIRQFQHALDRAGHPAPTTMVPVGGRGNVSWSSAELHPDAVPLLALAQHLGLPTSLLDWTQRARVAAYFAAREAADRSNKFKDRKLAVWALRRDAIGAIGKRVQGFSLKLETAPRSSNPNLHAQSGVFTKCWAEHRHELPVDEFIEEAARRDDVPPAALMCCATLPRSQAAKLLRLLHYEGVSGSTMFPGYAGVVLGMRERALWDLPPTSDEQW